MKKKFAIAGIAAFLLVCSAFVFAQPNGEGNGWGFAGLRNGMFGYMAKPDIKENLGLEEDATREEVKAAMLENLGLTEDSSKEEIRDAIKQKKIEMKEQVMEQIKEKLGLPSDATQEEVHDALQEWREENGVLCGACQGKMKGKGFGPEFHRGFGPRGEGSGNCPFSE